MTEQDDPTLPMEELAVATSRLGRYELLDKIGKGGMGVVHRARDTKLDRLVAIKLLSAAVEDDPQTRERFLREAQSAGELNHRNIIKIYDFGEEAGRVFIVMELLEGSSLGDFLKTNIDLSLERKIEILLGICEGLAFSHSRSIVHRDLKPGNLFITKDGQVKVLDFGLARIASSNLTRTGFVFGTPDYMSPEQVRGKVVDERSDIFSLGAVSYQVLSGRKPFAAKTLPEIMKNVLEDDPASLSSLGIPPSLSRIVARALQKDPLSRYQQVTELLNDLRRVDVDELPESAAPDSGPTQIGRYQIVEQIGRGGMGVVYRARDPVLNRDVAIKSTLVDLGADPKALAHFRREARAAARLQHPNIVTIYEFGEQDDSPYLIMEFLGGDDLSALINRGSAINLQRRLDILVQLCDGLGFAHEHGLVHRDIKPGNLRVLEDGTVKLLDFGIAAAPSSGEGSKAFAGSAAYASPEQLSTGDVDGRSDIFSAGVLAFEFLTGRQPFQGESPAALVYQILKEEPPSLRSIAPDLPAALEPVLSRALEKEPYRRWESARELGNALRTVAQELPGSQGPRTQATALAGGLTQTVGNISLQIDPGTIQAEERLGPVSPRVSSGAKKPHRLRSGTVWTIAALVLAASAGGAYVAYRTFGVSGANDGALTEAVEVADVDRAGVSNNDPTPLEPDFGAVPASPVLEVTTEPPGAAVTLDDRDSGETTPMSFPLVEPYPEMISVSLDGYEPATRPMPPVDGELASLSFELVRVQTFGRVLLSASYPFEVWIDERRLRDAATDHNIGWDTGVVTLRLRNTDYFLDSIVMLEVLENLTVRAAVPDLGSLSVFSNPGNCEIFVGTQSIDYPPITRRLLAPGQYRVSRRCPNAEENSEQRTLVVANEDRRVEFRPLGP